MEIGEFVEVDHDEEEGVLKKLWMVGSEKRMHNSSVKICLSLRRLEW